MPTIDISDKICSHCGGTSWNIEYRKKPTKANPDNKYIRYRCSLRGHERTIRWGKKNPEKLKSYSRKKEQRLKQSGHYQTIEYLTKAKIRVKKDCDLLKDRYIRYLFRKDVRNRSYILTPKEIEMYRIHLTIERKLKQL